MPLYQRCNRLSGIIALYQEGQKERGPAPSLSGASHPHLTPVNLTHKINEITCKRIRGYRQMMIVQF